MPAASWGPSCSIALRTKCDTRRRMEANGEARRDLWFGYLFPITTDEMPPFSWSHCPHCGGDIREGLRTEIARAPELTSPDWQADGEGEEC